MQTISILGAGWLGFKLGLYLQKEWKIKASTTSPNKLKSLESANFEAYLLAIEEKIEGDKANFFDTDILIISIPPRSKQNGTAVYLKKMQILADELQAHRVRKIVFISSTSVYPDQNQVASETDSLPKTDLYDAEQIFSQNPDFQTLILRCGGLAGYERAIGKYFSSKKDLANGKEIANLIHADDLVRIIDFLITKQYWQQILNICSPKHVFKEELYVRDCEKLGLPLPCFGESKPNSKIVNTKKIQDLGYAFIYSSPLDFVY